MNQPLIFVDEKAILMEHVVYVDFKQAQPTAKGRKVVIQLITGTCVIVINNQAIDLIVGVFVPEPFRSKYLPTISLVRN
jgi:hypothetical protein